MQNVLMALLTGVALVLQTSLADKLSTHRFQPDFLAIALVVSVFLRSGNGAVVWAGIIGLLADAFSPGPLGLHMVTALTIVAGLRWAWREPCRASLRFSACATLAVCCGWVLIPWAFTFVSADAAESGVLSAMRRVVSSALLATVLLLLVRAIAARTRHWHDALHENRWAMLR